jgi:predicted GIY-YIG superfamily endonuclease
MRKGIIVVSPLGKGETFACIYKFTLDNGSFYVGGTKRIAARIGQHRKHIIDKTHADNVLRAANGSLTITFEVLERVDHTFRT